MCSLQHSYIHYNCMCVLCTAVDKAVEVKQQQDEAKDKIIYWQTFPLVVISESIQEEESWIYVITP